MKRTLPHAACIVILALAGLAAVPAARGQEDIGPVHGRDLPSAPTDRRAILATASAEYPVTPGDVYELTYEVSSVVSVVTAAVGADSHVSFSSFGDFDARGLSFSELRGRVVARVLARNQGGTAQVLVSSVGVFQVYVKGEVQSAGWAEAWGLTRLHELVENRLTPWSSTRDIRIDNAAGSNGPYDLFVATRSGVEDQDPLVRAGDTVVVGRRDRQVTVTGEVERPGVYELRAGEELDRLLQFYAGGVTPRADVRRVEITRWDASASDPARMLRVDAGTTEPCALRDMDVVRVPSLSDRLPVVFFEGAIVPDDADRASATDGYARVRHPFVEGETLSSAVAALRARFPGTADLEHAFLVRDGAPDMIPVNLSRLMSGERSAEDLPLMSMDRIIVPRREFAVTVSGAVLRPGRYPYSPGRTWRYYVDLAGGFDPARHAGNSIDILDAEDRRLPADRPVAPEARILAPANWPTYLIAPVAETVTAVAAVVSAVFAIVQAAR